MKRTMDTLFETSRPGRIGYALPELDVPAVDCGEELKGFCRAEAPRLPELAEVDVVRHFTGLSKMNYSVDEGFYPLGSCTMKYNPKVNEVAARMPGFSRIHPPSARGNGPGRAEAHVRPERDARGDHRDGCDHAPARRRSPTANRPA